VTEIMEFSGPEELGELRKLLANLSFQLVEEIRAQRELLAAERGELHPQPVPVNTMDAVDAVIATYSKHPACDGKSVVAAPGCASIDMVSDPALLRRVLGNLVKNALEASRERGVVAIGCRQLGENRVEFSVHNDGLIPREAQLQIFNRSFSTKGDGRGLGTYSVKLLVERFLHGRVRFVSLPLEQTTFFVELPTNA
jgi:signal transduction histidine kinase